MLNPRSRLAKCALMSAAISVAACEQDKPIDCREVYRELDACVETVLSEANDADFAIDQCLPYSEPITITGLFVEDFEYNVFLEGPYAHQTDPWEIPLFETKLLWGRERERHEGPDGKKLATVSRVTFEGRRPLCKALPDEQWIIVDRLIEEEIVRSRPSEFP